MRISAKADYAVRAAIELAASPDAKPIKGTKLVAFMRWALTSGQAGAAALDYAPLPKAIADRLVDRLGSIRMAGTAATTR